MTRTYLLLNAAMNVQGVNFPAGPRECTDQAWTRMLREAGAEVLSEAQYTKLTAEAAAKAGANETAKATAPATGAKDGGTDPTSGTERDQISALDSINQHRKGRNSRRVS